MSSSVSRSLHDLFASKPSVAAAAAAAKATATATDILKPGNTPKPTTTTISKPKKPTKTTKPPRASSSHLDELQKSVARFKKLSESEKFRDQGRPYTAIVRRLAAAGKYSYIEDVIEHQKKFEKAMTNESFVVRLIILYGKSGMFEHAHKLFDEMPQLNCDRTVLSFNALLTACLSSKKYDKLLDIIREFPVKLSIKPDTVSYNIVIKAFCDMDSIDCAIEAIGAMERDGCGPGLIAFNTIIDALYKKKRHAEAEKIWEQMESKNIVPDVRSYNSKVRALCADERISEAVNLVGEMEGKGVKPDVYTYNGLLNRFCKDRNLVEVKKWYGEILKNDILPDQITFFMVVRFACDEGDFGFAHELSKEVIDRNPKGFKGKEILQRVVDGLVKELEVDKAEELVELVKSSKYLHFNLQLPTGK